MRADIGVDGRTTLRRRDGRHLDLDLRVPGLSLTPPRVALGRCADPRPDLSGACPREVEVDQGPVTTWWRGGGALEQGWTVRRAPPGEELRLDLGVAARLSGDVAIAGDFVAHHLSAVDARGRPLPARFVLAPDLTVTVDVRGATYPVTVDPLWEGTLWWTESFPAVRQATLSAAALDDLDGDGLPDLAVIVTDEDADLSTLFLVLGAPGGYADAAAQVLPLDLDGRTPRLTPLADVDGDGLADLLIDADGLDGGPLLVRGARSAPFPVSTLTGPWITYDPPVTGDLDGDGRSDLAYGGVEGGVGGTWVRSGTRGGFDAPVAWDPLGPPLAVADLSGDGRGDLVLGLAAPVFLADGPSGPRTPIAAPPHRITTVTVSPDVDGDGIPELVLHDDDVATVRLSGGGGADATPSRLSRYRVGVFPAHGDLTGDGLPDLVDDRAGWATSVLPDGRWQETSLASSGDGVVWRQPGDRDGDGHPELLVVADDEVVLLRGAAPLPVRGPPEVAWAHPRAGLTLVPVGDLDDDGFDDLATFTYGAGLDPGTGRLDLLRGGPGGPATVSSFTLRGVTGADARPSGSYGDLTGDGVDDLLVGAGSLDTTTTLALYPGGPAGPTAVPVWTVSGSTPAVPGGSAAAPGDVDGDGLADLVYTLSDVGYGSPGAVALARGIPGGLEPAPSTTLGVTLPADLHTQGDVDGDGRADVLFTGGFYGRGPAGAGVEVLLGDAGGWGGSLPLLAWTRGDAAAPAGDLDGDGRGEVVVTSATGDRLDTATAAAGALARAPDAVALDRDLGLGHRRLDTPDVNGDGLPDLLAAIDEAWLGGEGAALFLGRPGGWSSAPAWIAPPGASVVAEAGDVDGDGYDDLLVTTAEAFDLWFGGPRGPLPAPCAGGPDADGDGVCAALDVDDAEPARCRDVDGDGCDDCEALDGPDLDADGRCDLGDPDRDGDGAPDAFDLAPDDPARCGDSEGDGCDDCGLGPRDPARDGDDTDGDGACDASDDDDDGDGVPDALDAAPLDASGCEVDLDADGCDDCRSGVVAPLSDGPDLDGDGVCDTGDEVPPACPVGLTWLASVPPDVVGWAAELATVGDQDGDGQDDLVVVSKGRPPAYDEDAPPSAPSRAWLVSGAGGLLRELSASGEPRAVGVGTGDADGDGWPDVLLTQDPDVASGRYEERVVLGNVTFEPGGPAPTTPQRLFETAPGHDGQVSAAWLGDLHGDGYDDFAVLEGDAEGVGWTGVSRWALSLWAGGPDGPRRVDTLEGAPAAPAAGLDLPWDVDGDGRPELLVASDPPVLVGYDADGLQSPVPAGPSLGLEVHRMAHADVDGDGRDDLVLRERCGPGAVELRVRFGASTGLGAGAPDATFTADSCDDWAVADATGDGIADLLLSRSTRFEEEVDQGRVQVLAGGPGGPTPSRAVTWSSGMPGTEVGAAIAVLPGASPRLAVTARLPGSLTGGAVGVWPLGAPGQVGPVGAWRVSPKPLGRVTVVADFDQDGFDDLALEHGDVVDLHRGGPDGLVPGSMVRLFEQTLPMVPGDLDADGFPDLVTVTATSLRVLHGGPDGLTRTSNILRTGSRFGPLSDTDGNGTGELYMDDGMDIDGSWRPFRFDLAGTVEELRFDLDGVPDADGAALRPAGDLDGDGLQDVILLQTATGSYGAPDRSAAVWVPGGVRGLGDPRPLADLVGGLDTLVVTPAGDVDGDGFEDLALGEPDWAESFDLDATPVPGAPRGRLRVFRGGPSGPVEATALPGPAGDGRFAAAVAPLGDVDGDGRADLVVGTRGGVGAGAGAALYGGAPGGLDPVPRWVGPCEVAGAVLDRGDFHGDGVPELVAATISVADGTVVRILPLPGQAPEDPAPPAGDTAAPAAPTDDDKPHSGCACGHRSGPTSAPWALAWIVWRGSRRRRPTSRA